MKAQIRATIVELLSAEYPDSSLDEILYLESLVTRTLESKDLGRFKGRISPFKQKAIDAASGMSRPVASRRSLEKDSLKRLNRAVSSLERDMSKLWSRYRREEISRTKFRNEMKAALRHAYTDAYMLGTRASGLTRASDLGSHIGVDEKKWLKSVVSSEQRYFNRFLSELLKGTSKTKASVRIRNYANAVRSVYDSSRVLQLPDGVIIHWMLESDIPCPECRLLHKLSPFTKFTLPTTPKGGATRCLSNCYCRLRIVTAKPLEVQRVAKRNRSTTHLMKLLKKSRKEK